jgi:E3 ubiquitin-protein ligase UHRF1
MGFQPETHFTLLLKASVDTQNPVRVIRGFKLPSPYAPKTGYRYDGLYLVKKVHQEDVYMLF